MDSAKLRNLLRQASFAADNGKAPIARRLYDEILADVPENADALAGLAGITADSAERDRLLDQAFTIDPDNRTAKNVLAKLNEKVEEKIEAETVVEEEHDVVAFDETAVCKNHADRETSLRCIRCNEPICSTCAMKTPVGYTCPECIREAEDKYFDATALDYIIAIAVALPVSFIAALFLQGFGFWLLFIGGVIGTLIGRISQRLSRRRRGRYLPHVVAGCVIFSTVLLVATGSGSLFGAGIFALIAAPAAFYQLK